MTVWLVVTRLCAVVRAQQIPEARQSMKREGNKVVHRLLHHTAIINDMVAV